MMSLVSSNNTKEHSILVTNFVLCMLLEGYFTPNMLRLSVCKIEMVCARGEPTLRGKPSGLSCRVSSKSVKSLNISNGFTVVIST